jgi:hypothetical protein
LAVTVAALAEGIDPTMLSCTIDVLAGPSGTYTMSWEVHDRGTATCRLTTRDN